MTACARNLFFCLLLTAAHTQAQSQVASAEARAHFQEGVSHVRRGELQAALDAFHAAYRAQPHYSVLYNIGQAEAALGRPVEAVRAFERYLSEGAEQVSRERLHSVIDQTDALRKRIGQLRLLVPAPERSRVWLDGIELNVSQLHEPVQLEVGEHTLLHSSGAGHPVSRSVTITANTELEVQLETPPTPALSVGQVAITCPVPGVAVEISGGRRLVTPVAAPIVAPAGSVAVRFARPGYEPSTQVTVVEPGGLVKLECAQRPLPRLPPELRAELIVRPTPADALTLVDGQPFRRGTSLPSGPHDVLVQRDGFVPLRTTIDVPPRTKHTFAPTLRAAPSGLDLQKRRRGERLTFAYVLGGISAALLSTSGGLYLWNNGRYEKFVQKQPTSSYGRNLEFATSIQRVDDLTVGLLIGGVLTGAVGVWTFTTND